MSEALDRLPAELRRVLEAELAAGNAVAETGGGFPAAPMGFWVMLSGPFRSDAVRQSDVSYYKRGSPQFNEECGDTKRHCFLLSPPVEHPEEHIVRPPPKPERPKRMRRIRIGPRERTCFTRADVRGEELVYAEGGREAGVTFSRADARDIRLIQPAA